MAHIQESEVGGEGVTSLPAPEEALAVIAMMTRDNTGLQVTPSGGRLVLLDNPQVQSQLAAEIAEDGQGGKALVLRTTCVIDRGGQASILADMVNRLPAMGIAFAGENGSLWMCTRYSIEAPAMRTDVALGLATAEYALRLALPMLLLPANMGQGDAAVVEMRAGWFQATSPWGAFAADALAPRAMRLGPGGRDLHTATLWGAHGAQAPEREHLASLSLTTQASHPVIGCGLSWRIMPPTIWPTLAAARNAAAALNRWEWQSPFGPPTLGAWFADRDDECTVTYMGTAFGGLHHEVNGLTVEQAASWADTRAHLAYGRLAAAGLLPYADTVKGFSPG